MRIKNVIDYLDNIATIFPNKIAFVGEKSSLTFNKLKKETEKTALFLSERGFFKEPILVFMEKSPEEIATLLGIIRSGNYHVAIDSVMPVSRLKFIINLTEAKLIICDETTVEKAKELGFTGVIYCIDEIKTHKKAISVNDRTVLDDINRKIIDTDPIYVVFTSGSTGVPKGIVGNHRSVIDYIEELGKVLECDENTIFGNQAPLYMDACLKDLYTTLKYGATTYIIPQKLFTNPVGLIEYLNVNKINTICFVVSALTILIKLGAFEVIKPKYLKVVAFGGEVFPVMNFNEWRKACPDTKFINLYGVTECTGMSSFYEVKDVVGDDIPLGKPFPNTELFLLNGNEKVSKGKKGEICIRGTSLTMGYYKDLEQTESNFVQNPLNKNYVELIYRTGDIGYFDEDENLHFAGRLDNQVKHLGHRIELEEIEKVGNSITGIIKGVCIYDSVQDVIVFFYKGICDEIIVKKMFRESFAGYMVPRKVIRLEQIPMLSGGKPDRKTLAKLL